MKPGLSLKTRVVVLVILSVILFQATLTLSFATTRTTNASASSLTEFELQQRDRIQGILASLISRDQYALVVNALPSNSGADSYSRLEVQILLTAPVPLAHLSRIKSEVEKSLPIRTESGDSLSIVKASRIMPDSEVSDSGSFLVFFEKGAAVFGLIGILILTGMLFLPSRRKMRRHSKLPDSVPEEQSLIGQRIETIPLIPLPILEPIEPSAPIEPPPVPTVLNAIATEAPESIASLNPEPPRIPEENPIPAESAEPRTSAVLSASEDTSRLVRHLSHLPAVREEALIRYLFETHPSEAEVLRRVRLMFHDIPYYPSELTRKALADVDRDVVLLALEGCDQTLADEVLGLLPSLRSLEVQRARFARDSTVSKESAAESRRLVCKTIETYFESKQFHIADYWKDVS